MAKEIRYTMTSREAVVKIHDIVIAANIHGLKVGEGKTRRTHLSEQVSEGVSGTQGFHFSLAFALSVTMYIDLPMDFGDDQGPVRPEVTFSYGGTTHDLTSAVAMNNLLNQVVSLGATIDAVLDRETIKCASLSWSEERREGEKDEARVRYQEHLAREVGFIMPIGMVHKYDIGFALKKDSKSKKETFICGASAKNTSIACGNIAKHAIWTGEAWAARCGRHKNVLNIKADPIVDILSDYKKDYGVKFLTSPLEDEAA